MSKRVFIYRIEAHGCAALASPGATRRCERRRIRPYELLLLVWCEFDHARLSIGIECRENSSVGPEVGMAHMRVFNSAFHTKCEAAEFVRVHLSSCQ